MSTLLNKYKSVVLCLHTYLSWWRRIFFFGLHVQPDDFRMSPSHWLECSRRTTCQIPLGMPTTEMQGGKWCFSVLVSPLKKLKFRMVTLKWQWIYAFSSIYFLKREIRNMERTIWMVYSVDRYILLLFTSHRKPLFVDGNLLTHV